MSTIRATLFADLKVADISTYPLIIRMEKRWPENYNFAKNWKKKLQICDIGFLA
jgi:hypothetical protein